MENRENTPDSKSYLELGREADEAYRNNDFREAIRLYTDALDCLRRDAPWDRERKIRILSWLALSYQQVKDFHAACRVHESELRIARLLKDREKEANALHRLGDAYLELKDDKRAEQYLSDSLTLFRSLGTDRAEIPHILFDLAEIAEREKQFPTAIHHYQDWIRIQQNRRADSVPWGWYRLGRVAAKQSDWKTAEDHFYTVLVIAQESGDAFWEAQGLYGLGKVASEQQRMDRAEYLLKEALRHVKGIKRHFWMASIHRDLGYVACQKEDYQEGSRQFLQALRADNHIETWPQIIQDFHYLGAAQVRRNQPGFAALSFAMADAIKEREEANVSEEFVSSHRARCQKMVSEATWEQARERARTWSVSRVLDHFGEDREAGEGALVAESG